MVDQNPKGITSGSSPELFESAGELNGRLNEAGGESILVWYSFPATMDRGLPRELPYNLTEGVIISDIWKIALVGLGL